MKKQYGMMNRIFIITLSMILLFSMGYYHEHNNKYDAKKFFGDQEEYVAVSWARISEVKNEDHKTIAIVDTNGKKVKLYISGIDPSVIKGKQISAWGHASKGILIVSEYHVYLDGKYFKYPISFIGLLIVVAYLFSDYKIEKNGFVRRE